MVSSADSIFPVTSHLLRIPILLLLFCKVATAGSIAFTLQGYDKARFHVFLHKMHMLALL